MRRHVHHEARCGHAPCEIRVSTLSSFEFPLPASKGRGKSWELAAVVATTSPIAALFRRVGLGLESRIHLLRNLLTPLVLHERIKAPWARVDEMRGYTGTLIDYGKLGETNQRAMRLADFWLTEKDLILKLLKVPTPQYQNQNGSYTRMLQIPNWSEQDWAKMAVIEYKGNCLPPLPLPCRDSNLTLLNQLLMGMRQDLSLDQETSIHSPPTAPTPEI